MVNFILIDKAAGLPTSGQIPTSLLMPGALEKQFGWATTVLLALRESLFGRVGLGQGCRTGNGDESSSEDAVKVRLAVYRFSFISNIQM
jgi:hypothetical protein